MSQFLEFLQYILRCMDTSQREINKEMFASLLSRDNLIYLVGARHFVENAVCQNNKNSFNSVCIIMRFVL